MSQGAGGRPTISVIVPIYQVEPYLRACVDSILAQSFRDFELLLVDDGSPDGCGAICDEYARADARVRVFHRKNGGLSAARNTGLDNMTGEYVAMVDPDDVLLSAEYLQVLYEAAVGADADMALCGHAHFGSRQDPPPASGDASKSFTCTGEEYFYWKGMPRMFEPECAHGKLYRARLFEGVRYPEGRVYEDIAIQHRLSYPRERIVIVEASLYGYRLRRDGIGRGTPRDVLAQHMVRAMQDRMDYYASVGRPDLAKSVEQSLIRWLHKQGEAPAERSTP